MRSAKLQTFLGFHQFLLFSAPGSNPWFHTAFSHYILVSFDLWQFQNLLLFFTILTVLKSAGQAFCSVFPNLGLPDIFLMSRLGCGFSGKMSQRWSAFSSHHIRAALLITSYQGRMLSTWLITGDIEINPLVKVVFARFFHLNSLFFPLHMLYSLEVSHKVQPTQGEGDSL